ncbi:MAG: hypothetical protein NT094_03210, partial [Candidatus Staskawiczbacteria bacterium]|nr:hypothetical protein [Candidatus Staskawiczbacteria bacterium]
VPFYVKHFKDGTKNPIPYLTLDWITKWKSRDYGNVQDKLNRLKEKAPDKNKEYYQNTIDFIKHIGYFDSISRGKYIRSNYCRMDIIKEEFLKMLNFPVIIKSKSGKFKYVKILSFSNKSSQHKVLIDDNVFFVDFEDIDKLKSLQEKRDDAPPLSEIGHILQNIHKDQIEYIDFALYDPNKFKKPKRLKKRKGKWKGKGIK